MKKCSGLSLIELMVALAVTAIIATAAYQILNLSRAGAEAQQHSSQRLHYMDKGFQLLQNDLQQYVARPIRNSEQQLEPAFIGDKHLRFSRSGWSNPLQKNRAELQRVEYFVDNNTLYRRHYIHLDRADKNSYRDNTLIPGISDMQIRYLYAGDKQLDPVWLDHWPPIDIYATNKIKLEASPKALDIKFYSQELGLVQRVFLMPDSTL